VIYADGFEGGSLGRWSARYTDEGDLSIRPRAALEGALGLQLALDDNAPISVLDEHPAAESRYRARFHLAPNSLQIAQDDSFVLFFGYRGADIRNPVVVVEMRYHNGGYQLRAGLALDGGVPVMWRYGAWVPIANVNRSVEIEWRAAGSAGANNGELSFWINGLLRSRIRGVDNDTHRIERVRLGAAAGVDTGTRGTFYIDAFESRRLQYIGPAAVQLPPGDPPNAAPGEIDFWTEEEQLDDYDAEEVFPADEDERIFLPNVVR
jgi:hypothetical protein